MYTITMNNPGGVLDTRTAQTPEEAGQAAIDLIQLAGGLYVGDSIKVEGDEDDE